jgi:hypothetical protein
MEPRDDPISENKEERMVKYRRTGAESVHSQVSCRARAGSVELELELELVVHVGDENPGLRSS